MSNTPTVSVHEIEDLPLRSLFAREDRELRSALGYQSRLAVRDAPALAAMRRLAAQ